MLSNWYRELQQRNLLLAKSGGFCLLLGIFLVFLPLVDPRTLQGAFVWIKPAKFFLSIGIYFWTMGWMLGYLRNEPFVRRISWGIWMVMLLELFLITYQAAQGKLSHFNVSTLWDGFLFQLMGIAIAGNSVLVILVFLRFLKVTDLPSGYLMGIQVGLVIFLIAGF